MRLVCPNCSAQYEVPDNVIPEGGRDVQCSNCGHTWFQRHPDDDAELAEDLNAPLPDEEWDPDVPADEDEYEDDDDTVAAAPPPVPPPPRRDLDPTVAGILREEAEREKRVRSGQPDPLETQPDLGLEEAPKEDEEARNARQARERMARMRGEDPDTEIEPASAGSRRELLPDIDEINSKLRATSDSQDQGADDIEDEPDFDEIVRKGNFSRGFLFAVIVAAFLIAGYLFAPQISATIPAAAPTVELYVGIVDGLRDSLNAVVVNLLGTLGGLGGESQA